MCKWERVTQSFRYWCAFFSVCTNQRLWSAIWCSACRHWMWSNVRKVSSCSEGCNCYWHISLQVWATSMLFPFGYAKIFLIAKRARLSSRPADILHCLCLPRTCSCVSRPRSATHSRWRNRFGKRVLPNNSRAYRRSALLVSFERSRHTEIIKSISMIGLSSFSPFLRR